MVNTLSVPTDFKKGKKKNLHAQRKCVKNYREDASHTYIFIIDYIYKHLMRSYINMNLLVA